MSHKPVINLRMYSSTMPDLVRFEVCFYIHQTLCWEIKAGIRIPCCIYIHRTVHTFAAYFKLTISWIFGTSLGTFRSCLALFVKVLCLHASVMDSRPRCYFRWLLYLFFIRWSLILSPGSWLTCFYPVDVGIYIILSYVFMYFSIFVPSSYVCISVLVRMPIVDPLVQFGSVFHGLFYSNYLNNLLGLNWL